MNTSWSRLLIDVAWLLLLRDALARLLFFSRTGRIGVDELVLVCRAMWAAPICCRGGALVHLKRGPRRESFLGFQLAIRQISQNVTVLGCHKKPPFSPLLAGCLKYFERTPFGLFADTEGIWNGLKPSICSYFFVKFAKFKAV